MPALQLQPEPVTMPSSAKPSPKRAEHKSQPPQKVKAPREPKAAAEPPPPAPKPKSKLPLIAAGAGLVVVLAAVGVVVARSGSKPVTPPEPDIIVTERPGTEHPTTTKEPETPVQQHVDTEPVKEPVTEPVKEPVKEPAKEPEAAPEGVHLVLKSEPPARIKLLSGKRVRAQGKSPLSARLPPGTYDVEVSDDAQGLFKADKITLKSGADSVRETIALGKGVMLISSVPWSNVTVDGKALGSTPQKWEGFEGKHTVSLECSNGKKDQQKIDVAPGAQVRVKGKCE
jgi:hypothetical protein